MASVNEFTASVQMSLREKDAHIGHGSRNFTISMGSSIKAYTKQMAIMKLQVIIFLHVCSKQEM
jgi:hypothetical protein